MKKLFLTLSLCVLAGTISSAQEVFADDYVFQKQIYINDNYSCQAVRIHQNWFLTAAHCVDKCKKNKSCQVKLLLAQGPVTASAMVDGRDIFIPKQYRPVENTPSKTIPKSWDVALLHYQPEEYVYEFAGGGLASAEEFGQALKSSNSLNVQWQGAIHPHIPVLYTYGGAEEMALKQNLIVPWWNLGKMISFSHPQTVLYFGEKQSMWSSCGFSLDAGNSGGAVVLETGGVVGIVTAAVQAPLAGDVLQGFPCFKTQPSFLFNGFAPKTTLAFIKKTMARYGDEPVTQKLERVKPTTSIPAQ